MYSYTQFMYIDQVDSSSVILQNSIEIALWRTMGYHCSLRSINDSTGWSHRAVEPWWPIRGQIGQPQTPSYLYHVNCSEVLIEKPVEDGVDGWVSYEQPDDGECQPLTFWDFNSSAQHDTDQKHWKHTYLEDWRFELLPQRLIKIGQIMNF